MPHNPSRIDMTVTLTERARVRLDGERAPAASDQPALAGLLLAAYRGSVDEEEQTLAQALAEIGRTFEGHYGAFMPDCSRLIERNQALVAATLVTRWGDRPLVAFCMTAPALRRRGLARASLINTMQDLRQAGEPLLSLVVTVANRPACALYRQLGFVDGR